MQLNASKQTLAGLLGGLGYQLVIPPYQRPYAWGREQVDDLWDDVLAALGHGHFMGSLGFSAPTRPDPRSRQRSRQGTYPSRRPRPVT
ncbi:MAG: DUF262 domain-containing protein [Acidimicrobiia bacterium]|nr:DUF262 domain-containing protein [Acidimicrobiia bacterium]